MGIICYGAHNVTHTIMQHDPHESYWIFENPTQHPRFAPDYDYNTARCQKHIYIYNIGHQTQILQ